MILNRNIEKIVKNVSKLKKIIKDCISKMYPYLNAIKSCMVKVDNF